MMKLKCYLNIPSNILHCIPVNTVENITKKLHQHFFKSFNKFSLPIIVTGAYLQTTSTVKNMSYTKSER